jgi:hypothetical protein
MDQQEEVEMAALMNILGARNKALINQTLT